MKLKISYLFVIFTLGLGVSRAATVTWTGATDDDWTKGSNWSTSTVPTSADDVVIGAGAVVSYPGGGIAGKFATIDLGDGASLRFGGGGGNFNGEIWNISGTVSTYAGGGNGTYGIGSNGAILNFGVNGSFSMAGSTQNDLWTNGNGMTLSGVIDLSSGSAGAVVNRTLFSWGGRLFDSFSELNASFSELNGLTLTRLADNTTPVNAGEYSFQTQLTSGGSLGVSYMAVPEPSAIALLSLAGVGLAFRRRQ